MSTVTRITLIVCAYYLIGLSIYFFHFIFNYQSADISKYSSYLVMVLAIIYGFLFIQFTSVKILWFISFSALLLPYTFTLALIGISFLVPIFPDYRIYFFNSLLSNSLIFFATSFAGGLLSGFAKGISLKDMIKLDLAAIEKPITKIEERQNLIMRLVGLIGFIATVVNAVFSFL